MHLPCKLFFIPYISYFAYALPRPQYANCDVGYKRLIVFGDSFSDDGHGAWVVSNNTWPIDPAYAGHHFSNGPVWAQDLAKALNVELQDYATGGATVDNDFIAGFTGPQSEISVPSATDQIEEFLNSSSPAVGDIFVHWVGANDWFFDPSISASSLVSLITRNVDTLYRAGAKTILLADIPSPARFPATYGVSDYDPEEAQTFSDQLSIGLHNIVSAYSAYGTSALVEIGAFFSDIIASPRSYGISPGYLTPPVACLEGAYPSEAVPRTLCDDPSKHLYFDVYHPTKEVHRKISDLFLRALRCT